MGNKIEQNATRIAAIALHVSDPENLVEFYCNMLGMSRQAHPTDIAVGYGGQGAVLILRPSSAAIPYAHAKTDRYWKIALTLPDLDHAHAELVSKGAAPSRPHQFRDIAYMSHLTDPEGHIVELIQHTVEGAPKSRSTDVSQPLGGGVELGLITLRTNDIERELQLCQQTHKMSYLSRQSLSDLGFDLYFFGPSNIAPPNDDLSAIENRPWLWQRPFTSLEFQHLLDSPDIHPATEIPAEVLIVNAAGQEYWLQ